MQCYSLGCYIFSVLLLQEQYLTFLEFTVFYCQGLTVFHRKIYKHFLQYFCTLTHCCLLSLPYSASDGFPFQFFK